MATKSDSIAERQTLPLQLRGTFIDVARSTLEAEGLCSPNAHQRRRAVSVGTPRRRSFDKMDELIAERLYVEQLSSTLSSLQQTSDAVHFFQRGEDQRKPKPSSVNIAVGLGKRKECITSPINSSNKGSVAGSIASTTLPPSSRHSDSSDSLEATTVSVSMQQLAQGYIQDMGQAMTTTSACAEDVPTGRSIPIAINNTVADMILQVKAEAFQTQEPQGQLPAVFQIQEDEEETVKATMTTTSTSDDNSIDLSSGKHCSRGSIGHPELCSRPCLYFVAGACGSGSSCEYCHLAHPKRPAHLDKRHREMLRNMSVEEWASLVLPVVHKRVQAVDDSEETRAMFWEIPKRCAIPFGVVPPTVAHRSQRMLMLTLRSMSLKTLLSTVQRGLADRSDIVEEAIEGLLQHLRRLAANAATSD